MTNVLRLPINQRCCSCCNHWRRRVWVAGFVLALLSLSSFILHFLQQSSKKRILLSPERELPVQFRPDSKSLPVYFGATGKPEKYEGLKPRDSTSLKSNRRRSLVPCSNLTNQHPRGPIEADVSTFPDMKELEATLADRLQLGGHYIPKDCRTTQKIAVIVPYRDREIHLELFLQHMHPFLQRQNVDYYIVVVEQAEGTPFNRALLFNIGFYKMNKIHDIDCYIFHDVDLLPLDDRILYLCQDQPLHLSMLVDTLGENLMYDGLFGGVVALTPEMMETVNGFSNLFFGWGGEDDDMSYRIRHHGYSIDRYSKEVSRYTMMRHAKEEYVDQGKINRKVDAGKLRVNVEGLNTLRFHLLEFQPLPLYTWILVKPNASMINEVVPLPGAVDPSEEEQVEDNRATEGGEVEEREGVSKR